MPQQYDSAIKCISSELSTDIATLILGRKPDLEQISETLLSGELRVDFLAKVAGDEESLIHTRVSDQIRPKHAGADARVLRKDSGPIRAARAPRSLNSRLSCSSRSGCS